MTTRHDSTAPACDALAAWDKLFNEREALNQYLDCSNDAAYHEPEGKLPAETVRDLATAATLLEHVNTLIDKANERQARRPATTRTKLADAINNVVAMSDAERDDPKKLPFSQATGTKLVAIAEHELLNNFSHAKNVLPPDWSTLYQLARLPAPKLKKLIDAGEVTPDLSRAAATQMAKENKVPTSKAKNPKALQAKAAMSKRELARAELIDCLKKLKEETRIDELREIAAGKGRVRGRHFVQFSQVIRSAAAIRCRDT